MAERRRHRDSISKAGPVRITDTFGNMRIQPSIKRHTVPREIKRRKLTEAEQRLVSHRRARSEARPSVSLGL
jgi:hypothetical protein